MACAMVTMSFGFRCLPSRSSSCTRVSYCSVRFPLLNNTNSPNLSWSSSISGSIIPQKLSTVAPHPQTQRLRPLTIVSSKGYKMKTHKASAKRFRVTGQGKIVRRRAGKQHLLYKKNSKRKLRLSKMHPVSRSDYDNVIGCLPYLKVNRKAQ